MVIEIHPLVGAGDNHCLFDSDFLISAFHLFHHFFALQEANIVETVQKKRRWLHHIVFRNLFPQFGGIGKNTAVKGLSGDLRERMLLDVQTISLQVGVIQSGTDGLTDGRQLGIISDEKEAAIPSGVNIFYQIIEQPPCSETLFFVSTRVGNHGGFVHDGERILVRIERETEAEVSHGFLAVDLLVNGIGRHAGIGRQDLCCPSGRCQKQCLLAETMERLYNACDETCFARACIAAQKEKPFRVG